MEFLKSATLTMVPSLLATISERSHNRMGSSISDRHLIIWRAMDEPSSSESRQKPAEESKDFNEALLNYRNTPQQGDTYSPVQRMMSRRTRTMLLTTRAALRPLVIKLRTLNFRPFRNEPQLKKSTIVTQD